MSAESHLAVVACSLPRRYWHIAKFNMAAAAILRFSGEFCTFRHDGCLVLELCTKFGSNMWYNRWQRPTFVPDIRLMTSCELTSGFFFGHVGISAWSCYIFVPNFVQMSSSSTDILAFYEGRYSRRPPSWICWGKSWNDPRQPIRRGYPV